MKKKPGFLDLIDPKVQPDQDPLEKADPIADEECHRYMLAMLGMPHIFSL